MTPLAVVIALCGHLPQSYEAVSQPCAIAVQTLVCSRRETVHIRNDDPALPIFWQKDAGESLQSAKIDLADERVNGCDPANERMRR